MAVAGAASLLFSSAGSAAHALRQSQALGCPSLGCPRPFRLIRLCEVLPPERGGSVEGGPEYASASTSADPDAILEAIAMLGFGTMGEFADWVTSATDAQIDASVAFIRQYATQEAGQ